VEEGTSEGNKEDDTSLNITCSTSTLVIYSLQSNYSLNNNNNDNLK
jgi:hypothetical protein